jgi:pimeloyl-ACP methyl ester carboxylesterase
MLGDSLLCTTRGAGDASTSLYVPQGAPGRGVPLFLAPAFGLDGRSFERLSPLAADRPVAFWNLPNQIPDRGGPAALARLYLDHADRAGMSGRLVFGGSSLGGTMALAAALEAPERCAALVLIAASASWRELGPRLHIGRHLLPFLPEREFHRPFATILFGPQGVTEDRDGLRLQAAHRTKPYARSIVRLLLGDGPYDLSHRLHEIAAPVLVLHDPRERVVPFGATEALARMRRAQIVEIPKSGHLPHVSAPEACLAAIAPFLAAIDAGEAAAVARPADAAAVPAGAAR